MAAAHAEERDLRLVANMDDAGAVDERPASEDAERAAGEGEWASYLEDDDVIYATTQIFDALADYTRFRILGALTTQDRSVGELTRLCGVSQSAISHQLRLLRDRGLVTMRREGQRSIYSLADEHVATLIAVALEHAGHWPE